MQDQTSNRCPECERLEKENMEQRAQIEKWHNFYALAQEDMLVCMGPDQMSMLAVRNKKDVAREMGLEV